VVLADGPPSTIAGVGVIPTVDCTPLAYTVVPLICAVELAVTTGIEHRGVDAPARSRVNNHQEAGATQ
jgi:hypothetical protein